jgi:23S rRNA (guanine745-N1)-methyltransferase
MAERCDVLRIDLSSAGIDHAAKIAKRLGNGAGFVVASLFTMPVADASMDAVTNIFAPCAEDEFCRVLKNGGYLIVVAAGERHLLGLKRVLYENPYYNPERADLPQKMTLVSKENLTYEIEVDGQDAIDALFSMTPYYWRTSEKDKAKLASLQSLKTEVDFDIYLYRKGNDQ